MCLHVCMYMCLHLHVCLKEAGCFFCLGICALRPVSLAAIYFVCAEMYFHTQLFVEIHFRKKDWTQCTYTMCACLLSLYTHSCVCVCVFLIL